MLYNIWTKIAAGFIHALGILLLCLVLSFAGTVPASSQDRTYYRYACGTYTCASGKVVPRPGRVITPSDLVIQRHQMHWSSVGPNGQRILPERPQTRVPFQVPRVTRGRAGPGPQQQFFGRRLQ